MALIAANGFLVAVEFAVVSVGERRARLEQMAVQGNKLAGPFVSLLDWLTDWTLRLIKQEPLEG